MEAVYLARQAGFVAALIDKDPQAPARALADEFFHLDLLADGTRAGTLLQEFDLILPATENSRTLARLTEMAGQYNVPLALDLPAYMISSSKLASNRLFARAGVAMPAPWPGCGFPVIVKPSGLSGSAGVVLATDEQQLVDALAVLGREAVVQKYQAGPAYSLEVLAHRGECTGLQVTQLNFDAGYDCKRVLAGPQTGSEVAEDFYDLADRIAAALNLSGLMDIEVIAADGELKVLEIDARLPSQTPGAVYHSTGINMVELLAGYWINGQLPSWQRLPGDRVRRAVIYEHLKFSDGVLAVAGEHILTGAQGLKVYRDKFSTDVLLANFEASPAAWVATAIYTENTEAQVWETRNRAVKIMQQAFKANSFLDPHPFAEGSAEVDQTLLRNY